MRKLTVRKIESAQGPARLVDEHGLYLRVSPRGAKRWIQRLTIRGRRTDNGIGHYPSMGLAEARAVAFERWKIAKADGDPREAGSRPPAPTFAEAAEAVIAIQAPSWRNPKSGPQWQASLQTYAYPTLGALPVSEITPGHVMAVLEPIWNEKRETARQVKQRISAICRWAVAQGHHTDDPAGVVIDADGLSLPLGVVHEVFPLYVLHRIVRVAAPIRCGRPSDVSDAHFQRSLSVPESCPCSTSMRWPFWPDPMGVLPCPSIRAL